ncbi:uncharacterized protein EAF02_007318 [Botrytis sinoallii]|uniref:uncharacterized protein n=1 Tax=Botrytis sinoallii TaxID=1463999 RepID=UPI0018FFB53A|nr:uncharacterized protein EAF02_007318 [Botrytis sinoallii]KAF7880472.1 hypothetical protein EAF02_007318 [Botrytis sinoallii]
MNTWTKRLVGQTHPIVKAHSTTLDQNKITNGYDHVQSQTLVEKSTTESNYQNMKWEDFNHQQTLVLGYTNSTFIAYPKETKRSPRSEYVLKSCTIRNYTPERLRLVDLAREPSGSEFFLTTLCVFRFEERMYVGSELSDVSLEDIIHCTIHLSEDHLSAVLIQVVSALSYLHKRTRESGIELIYDTLDASTVFLKRNGKVQLANFGSRIIPKMNTPDNCRTDLHTLGNLAIHIITQSSDQPDTHTLRQKMLSGNATGKGLDASFEPSPEFLDFYEMCFSYKGDIHNLLKHPFLKHKEMQYECLIPLVHNAERVAARECISNQSALVIS